MITKPNNDRFDWTNKDTATVASDATGRIGTLNALLGSGSRMTVTVDILDFLPTLAPRFRDLNMEWLADFGVEPPDIRILDSPRECIIDKGGVVLFAQLRTQIVGTCALIPTSAHHCHFELAKMAVARAHQGMGIGRQLLIEALRRFKSLGGSDLHLETNSRLRPAIHLYESLGFRKAERPGGLSKFARADVYMVYEDDAAEGCGKQSC